MLLFTSNVLVYVNFGQQFLLFDCFELDVHGCAWVCMGVHRRRVLPFPLPRLKSADIVLICRGFTVPFPAFREDVVIDSPSMECVMAEPDGCEWLEGR